jgi:hypothetical protein
MDNHDTREEVPMTAQTAAERRAAIRPTLVLYELAGSACRMARSVPAGESVQVNTPFPVELRPADLIGPRRRD